MVLSISTKYNKKETLCDDEISSGGFVRRTVDCPQEGILHRRTFLGAGAAVGTFGLLAGCTTDPNSDGGSGSSDGGTGSAIRPRIGIAGISLEASTFSPQTTPEAAFTVRRGTEEVLDQYSFLQESSPFGQAQREAADYVGVLTARSSPGGALEAQAYEGWKQEIVDGLASAQDEAPLDGFFFDIHGAMSVVGLEDAEGDLITAIRNVLGSDVVVGAIMDPHGNVSETLFEACDLMTSYRKAPHIDSPQSHERALRNLVDLAAAVADGGKRPHKALVHVPILLPGEKTSTLVDPGEALAGRIPEYIDIHGVTDLAYWLGFPWADEPRNKAAIAAFGEDAETVEAAVLDMATEVWDSRHDFDFIAPTGTFDECLDQAISSDARPFWISDTGDNPGAGGADDTTYALARLIDRPEIRDGSITALMVSLMDPDSTKIAHELGVDGRGDFKVGGKVDDRDPGPVSLSAEVASLNEAEDTGRAAALRVLDGDRQTGLTVVVTELRSQWGSADMYEQIGLSMTGFDVVTVKMGYLVSDQQNAAADWLMALTPGGVDQDLKRLGHSEVDRPMIPFDDEIPAPDVDSVVRGGGD